MSDSPLARSGGKEPIMDIVEGVRTQDADEFPVFVSWQGESERPPIRVKPEHTLRDVLVKAGIDSAEAGMVAFLPADTHGDDGERVDDAEHASEGLDVALSALGIGRGARIVCATCRWVEVTIHYQHETAKHRFRPSARVRRVLRWARQHWHLDGEETDSLKLRICASRADLRESTRLAELLQRNSCELCLELVPGPKVNG